MNRVVLLGRLTKTPELRYTRENNAYSSFTIAVNRKAARQGEKSEADFISAVALGKQAEFLQKYTQKGSRILVWGNIRTRSWNDKEGKHHSATQVLAEEIYMADSQKDQVPKFEGYFVNELNEQVNGFEIVESEKLPF